MSAPYIIFSTLFAVTSISNSSCLQQVSVPEPLEEPNPESPEVQKQLSNVARVVHSCPRINTFFFPPAVLKSKIGTKNINY